MGLGAQLFPAIANALAGSILQTLPAQMQLLDNVIRFCLTCILKKLVKVVSIHIKTHLALA
jgi:hypothetical protein